jgi:hypothetical protein
VRTLWVLRGFAALQGRGMVRSISTRNMARDELFRLGRHYRDKGAPKDTIDSGRWTGSSHVRICTAIALRRAVGSWRYCVLVSVIWRSQWDIKIF